MSAPEFEDPRSLEEEPDPEYVAELIEGREKAAAELASWGPVVEATTSPSWPAIVNYLAVLHREAIEQLVRAGTIEEVARQQGKVEMLRNLIDLPRLVAREVDRLTAFLSPQDNDHEGETVHA